MALKNQELLQTWIKPWIIACLLCTAAMGMGFFLGWAVLTATTDNFIRDPETWDRVIEGFVRGMLVASLQWPIVRVAGVRAIPFMVASGVGLAVGYPTGQFVSDWGFGLPWVWAFAIYGLLLGVPQWLVIRSHVKGGWIWIPISTIGWMLTILVWGGVMDSELGFVGGLGVGAILFGLIFGTGLVWLVKPVALFSFDTQGDSG